jgi:hypothetical protein
LLSFLPQLENHEDEVTHREDKFGRSFRRFWTKTTQMNLEEMGTGECEIGPKIKKEEKEFGWIQKFLGMDPNDDNKFVSILFLAVAKNGLIPPAPVWVVPNRVK